MTTFFVYIAIAYLLLLYIYLIQLLIYTECKGFVFKNCSSHRIKIAEVMNWNLRIRTGECFGHLQNWFCYFFSVFFSSLFLRRKRKDEIITSLLYFYTYENSHYLAKSRFQLITVKFLWQISYHTLSRITKITNTKIDLRT